MKYVCKNPDCKKYNIEEFLITETFRYRDGKLVGEHVVCPICGKEREEVNPGANIPLSEKNVSVGMYSSMSMEERREALKKRSKDHFNKEIKERKDSMQNQVQKEWREYKSMKQ